MDYLVDLQYYHIKGGGYGAIFGIYSDKDNAVAYYKEQEFKRYLNKNRVRGVKYQYESIREVNVYQMDGITFIVNQTNMKKRDSLDHVRNIYNHSTEGKHRDFFRYGVETVYLKPIKVSRFVSSVRFWYKGVMFEYKAEHKERDYMHREAGFTINSTLLWKPVKKSFATTANYSLSSEMQYVFAKHLWCDYMTNDYFVDVINEFQQFYKIKSLYDTKLPYCTSLDLSKANLSDVTSIWEFLNNSKRIKYVNFGRLNLNNMVNLAGSFWRSDIECLDFSHCIGDIQYDKSKYHPNFNLDTLETDSRMLVLLNSQQANLAFLLKEDCPSYSILGIFDYEPVSTLKSRIDVRKAKYALMMPTTEKFIAIVK